MVTDVAQSGVNSESAQRERNARWLNARNRSISGKGLQSMSESKPIAIWVRIAARIALGLCVIPVVGAARIYWRDGVITNGPWMEWFITAYVAFPLLLGVAFQGRTYWRQPHSPALRKCKSVFDTLYAMGFFALLYRHNSLEAYVLAILLTLVFVYAGLSIYFASVKTKLDDIAKFKARHGIPLDQPHKEDEILKEGVFRIR
jgi:energy-coupling factor transporter transmembrane protein EcfT